MMTPNTTTPPGRKPILEVKDVSKLFATFSAGPGRL